MFCRRKVLVSFNRRRYRIQLKKQYFKKGNYLGNQSTVEHRLFLKFQKIKINVDKELGLLLRQDQKKKYLNYGLLKV
ncbi:unnamed protein product [Leptosia nina]|uniref:Ribosomal protein S4 n=1 Tax=Leptosia nina TaxID=320188 RepID=A0AAV1JN98_9NEOP